MRAVDQRGHLLTYVVRHGLDGALTVLERLESCIDVPAIDVRDALDRVGDTPGRRARPGTSALGRLRGGIEVPCPQVTLGLLQEHARRIGEVVPTGERHDRAERDDRIGQFVARRAGCGQEHDGYDRSEECHRERLPRSDPTDRGHASP
ncbi:MAG TPA: hypothetical protein VNS49_21185 [Streptomyces sp.]|nr:hypothetical protein [Streptomyces sp.]